MKNEHRYIHKYTYQNFVTWPDERLRCGVAAKNPEAGYESAARARLQKRLPPPSRRCGHICVCVCVCGVEREAHQHVDSCTSLLAATRTLINYVCVCVCMYVCVYIYIYTHTHTYAYRSIYAYTVQIFIPWHRKSRCCSRTCSACIHCAHSKADCAPRAAALES
jgi:hypothetical protein